MKLAETVKQGSNPAAAQYADIGSAMLSVSSLRPAEPAVGSGRGQMR